MAGKNESKRPSSPLGPGIYDPKFTFDSTKVNSVAPKFPKEDRSWDLTNIVPAPGTYDPKDKAFKTLGGKFGKDSKNKGEQN